MKRSKNPLKRIFLRFLMCLAIFISLILTLYKVSSIIYTYRYLFLYDIVIPECFEIPFDHLELLLRKKATNSLQGYSLSYGIKCIEVTKEGQSEPIKYESVKMGHYPQGDNAEESEPVEWLIIDENNGETLLLSKYYLDALPYDNKLYNVSWKNSQLREWLNDEFFKSAFNSQEQEAVETSRISSDSYQSFKCKGILPSRITKDKVFVLDSHEKLIYLVLPGYIAELGPEAEPTQYAKNQLDDSSREYTSGVWTRFRAVPNMNCQICWSCAILDSYTWEDYFNATEDAVDTKMYVRPAVWVDSDYINELKEKQ